MSDGEDRGATPLAAFYFAWIAAIGAFGPFMASFLEGRGLGARSTAWVLAALPLVRVVVTPLWTYLADLVRAPTRVLQWVSTGSLVTFALVALAHTPAQVAAAVLLYTVFRAPVGALADAVLLAWSQRTGTAFGRVRAFGSAGYLVATLAAGVLLDGHGPWPALALAAALLALATVCVRSLPAAPAHRGPSLWPSFVRLARDPRVLRVLAAGVLQQMGLAPYDNLFPTWFARRAGGAWSGASIAVGVACEVAVMVWARPWIARVGPERTMALSFAMSVLRWAVIARAESPWVLGLTQSLHAVAFATYFLAAVELLDRAAPPELRASAQGIQYTVVFGGGSALSLAIGGALGGVEGVRAIFALAAVCSGLAAVLMATAPRGEAAA